MNYLTLTDLITLSNTREKGLLKVDYSRLDNSILKKFHAHLLKSGRGIPRVLCDAIRTKSNTPELTERQYQYASQLNEQQLAKFYRDLKKNPALHDD